MVKKVTRIFAVIGLVIFFIFLRVFIQQYSEFKKGEVFYINKKYKDATTCYETAIHMYTPASPFVKKSINRMVEIARIFEENKEYRWALVTYENLRSSLYSVRSFFLPYQEIITLCDTKIAELVNKAYSERP